MPSGIKWITPIRKQLCVGKVKRTSERFSWYGSDDPMAMNEQPSCWQYKPGIIQAVRPLNWHEKIDEDDDNDNWVHPGALSGGRSRPGYGNDNDDCEREEDAQGGEKGTGKGTEQRTGRGMGRGWGRETVKERETAMRKVLLNKPQGEMISHVTLLCSCRSKCQRQTRTRRAN